MLQDVRQPMHANASTLDCSLSYQRCELLPCGVCENDSDPSHTISCAIRGRLLGARNNTTHHNASGSMQDIPDFTMKPASAAANTTSLRLCACPLHCRAARGGA